MPIQRPIKSPKRPVKINDYRGFGSERVVWFDMDLDGQPDKIDFLAATKDNSVFLKIFKYISEI